jgi:hypothetical protein
MEKQLQSIIKEAYSKYGKDHYLTIVSAQMLSPFIKTSLEQEVDEVLSQTVKIDIDQLESLLSPDNFDFQPEGIGEIGVEK